MADPRFFRITGPYMLGELASIANATLLEKADNEKIIYDVMPLNIAGNDHISFLDNKKYFSDFCASSAGACIVDAISSQSAPEGMSLLISEEPYRSYALVANHFYPDAQINLPNNPTTLISSSAIIDDTAFIGPGTFIGDNTEIGKNTRVNANTTIGPGVRVGDNCQIDSNVTLQCCLISDRVIIHPGARIGQDGFGFALHPTGHLKVPQLGRVIIEDDVEIGANTTIDRGTGPDTFIGSGSKIDNLVQIAHNVKIGENCIIVSQVGISGSTELGSFVVAGGQAGLTGHLKIGEQVQIAAQSGVMRDIKPGEKVGGSPAKSLRVWLKEVATIEKLVSKGKFNNES